MLKEENRIIAHLDMDAFFASIEERDDPRLKGLPIAVGSDPRKGHGRGVISTANYKAREYGICSALPVSRAWRFSEAARKKGKPAVVFITPDFKKYTESSKELMAIIHHYSPHVEQASIDEAYFDLSYTIKDLDMKPQTVRTSAGSFKTCGPAQINADGIETRNFLSLQKVYARALKICQKIKQEILEKEKLTASIGIGPNKLIAKLASDFKKPNGLTLVSPDKVESFLNLLPIRKIPGIGPKTEMKLLSKKIKTVHDIKRLTQMELHALFGKWGIDLYEKVRGHDDSLIVEEYETKSIGEQETFEKDTLDSQFIFARLDTLCKNVITRLYSKSEDNRGRKPEVPKFFRTVVITIRFSDFETKTRSHTLSEQANSLKKLQFEVMKLALPFLDKRANPKKKLIRLIGVRIEKLET